MKYLALSMDGDLDKLNFYIGDKRGLVEYGALGRQNYGVGLARVLGAGARSVLLVGSEVATVFRPDLTLTEVRGVPLVLALTAAGKEVVGVATWHPSAALKVKKLRDGFEQDVKQWLWRGMYGMQKWPETCVKCGAGVDHYDEQGVAWCKSHWRGVEVPKFKEQLSLDVAGASVA